MYVSLFGKDTGTCGSKIQPCRTIEEAVRRIDRDGHIYLNGTGTKSQPFSCEGEYENVTAHDQKPGISITKSVSLEGIDSTAFVVCEEGFHFYKTKETLKITLSGIAFNGTPLVFDDCDQVWLTNCSHQNTLKPVSLVTNTIPVLRLDIQGGFFFQNSHDCVEITLRNKSCHSLFLKLNGVNFQENGVLYDDQHTSVKALVSIATDEQTPSKPTRHLHISCLDVVSIKNKMPFLVLDLPTTVTKEVFRNMNLINNDLSTAFNVVKNKRHFTDALYISRARKTDVSFANFVCANNSNDHALRCIKISSDSAKVNIENSLFAGFSVTNAKGGAVSVVCKLHSSLVVTNTTFENTTADHGGGAIFSDTSVTGSNENQVLRVNFTNVNFSNCGAITQGSAVMVGKLHKLKSKPITYTLNAHFKNVNVKNCTSKNSSIYLVLRSGHVVFQQFHFRNEKLNTTGEIYIGGSHGATNVIISESSFHYGRVFARIEALQSNKGSVRISNTSMFKSYAEGALVISPKYRISLSNVTISFCKHALVVSQIHRFKTILNPVHVVIDNCTFEYNAFDVTLTLLDPHSVSFGIVDTIFRGTRSTFQHHGHAVRFFTKSVNRATVKITLDKVIFDSRPASSFALLLPGKKNITVKRSIFRHCASFRREEWNCGNSKSFYVTASGAISIISLIDKPWKLGCCQRFKSNNTHPTWRYESNVTFEDTIFQENTGLNAGAVFVSNGYTTFRNCSFENNLATGETGQVYLAYGTGTIEFYDCSFLSSLREKAMHEGKRFWLVAFFHSDSDGSVAFRNTSMISSVERRRSYLVLVISNGAYVDIDENTTILCRKSQLSLQKATHFIYTEKRKSYCLVNVTVLRFSCRLCSPGFYSLQTGHSHGLIVNDSFHCQSCPLGATCIANNVNIAAKENFWGYKTHDHGTEKLKFVPCPKRYCQAPSPRSGISVCNSCYGNRTGVLCGQCAPGFSESLFSAKCNRPSECNHYLLWIFTFFYLFAMALYLITKPPLLSFLSAKHILWFTKKNRNLPADNNREENEKFDSGYLKIVFYYYQVADLLLGNSLEEVIPRYRFTRAILSVFNFEVNTADRGIDCPLSGLTAVTKQLLLSLTVLGTMVNVFLIYCLHLVINMARKIGARPPLSHYMAVVLEILLLGYDRLAETSLVLMHCVSIGSERRLFLDGNTPCWEAWQYLLLSYIIVFVVPFIAVLYYGSLKLHKSTISARSFLAACVIPLPFLIYWFLKRVFNKRNRRQERDVAANDTARTDVVEVLQESFRPPIGQDSGTLYWESVLIGRRLILLTFHSFIQNDMLKVFLMAISCDLMAIHHVVKNPFRDPTANKVEATSLITLAIIAKISLIKATLLSSGINAKAQNEHYIQGMEWFELIAMSFVPVIICLTAVLAFLSQIVRLFVYVTKVVIIHVQADNSQRSLQDLQEPLLQS